MKERTKKILFVGIIVLAVVLIYAGFEAYRFFSDVSLTKKIQEELVSGQQEKALMECDTLHYWRTSLCSSLKVAVEVASNPGVQLSVCDGIIVEYDGPWWLPIKQKYLDDMNERKRTCITTILSRHNLS